MAKTANINVRIDPDHSTGIHDLHMQKSRLHTPLI